MWVYESALSVCQMISRSCDFFLPEHVHDSVERLVEISLFLGDQPSYGHGDEEVEAVLKAGESPFDDGVDDVGGGDEDEVFLPLLFLLDVASLFELECPDDEQHGIDQEDEGPEWMEEYLKGQQSSEATIIFKLQDHSHSSEVSSIYCVCFDIGSDIVIIQMQSSKDYEPLDVIGKGSFGVVRKVRRKSDKRVFVSKEINFCRLSAREKQQLVTEVNVLKGLQHPNIVCYEDRVIDKAESKLYIIMEYCVKGDLGTWLKEEKQKMDFVGQDIIWKIAYQVLLALDYCHNRVPDHKGKGGKVIHRDIKPANIFINETNHIKLGDFGLSREMGEHSEFAETHVGTPYYMSPEQVKNARYNQKSDIWSAGCLIYQLAALRRPFEANNHLNLARKIESGRFQRIPFRFSENLFSLICKMLVVDPEKRPSARQLLKTPLFEIRTMETELKDKIEQLKKKETELAYRQNQYKERAERMKQLHDLPHELTFLRNQSSRQADSSDKENNNRQNYFRH